jgi:hypothetical protein
MIGVLFSPNGTNYARWKPSGSGADFSFPSGSILEPLAPHKSKLVVCGGIDFKGVSNHAAGMAAMLTGGGAASTTQGMSLDQYVASKIGDGSRFESLQFGVQSVSAWGTSKSTCMTYGKGGVFVAPDDNPASAFKRMFGDPNASQEEAAQLLVRRQSVIDVVKADLDSLAAKLGKTERVKLEQHLDSLRKIEISLQGSGNCEAPDVPTGSHLENDNFKAVGEQQTDLLVLALACGMTRVASLQWSHTIGPPVFTWLGLQHGHHSLSHQAVGGPAFEDFIKAERWYAEQFGALLSKLEATPDPENSGSLLDSTMVLWCKELGDGPNHECTDVPFVIAGGNYFPLGRFVDGGGAAHQKLLVSMCHAMGLENQSFGDVNKGQGPLDGLA